MIDIQIYNYTDYPSYLRDLVHHKKNNGSAFSYRSFSLRAGISTENYLKLVIEGKKRLGFELCERFIKGLSLKKSEAEYFRALVGFQLASTLDAKQIYLEKMEELKRKDSKKARAEYKNNSIHRHWYTSVIWELASCKDFLITPQNIIKALKEKITLKQAQTSIETLLSQGLLKKENNKIVQAPFKITSSNGIEDIYLQANHKKMSLMAAQALEENFLERAFQGLTIAINPKHVLEVKKDLSRIIQDLQEKYNNDPEAQIVCRFNLQCFPVADTRKI